MMRKGLSCGAVVLAAGALWGAADSTCPPMAGFSAYNVTPSKDKRILMVPGQGHGVSDETYRRIGQWLKEEK